MLDTCIHIDINDSFEKLPVINDSTFSFTSISKLSLIDSIDYILKKQLSKLEIVNVVYDKNDTFTCGVDIVNSLKVYKIGKYVLTNNFNSYIIYVNQSYAYQKLLMINVSLKGDLVSIFFLGGRMGLNNYYKTRFSGNRIVTMIDEDLEPNKYVLFTDIPYSFKTDSIIFEFDLLGKWEKIKHFSLEKREY
jgi:hypothetical protein